MYMRVPPYGSPVFNGTSAPPYDVPFSGGSSYHYNYGSRFSGGSPYRPLHISAPPPYSSGSVMRSGRSFLHLPICWFTVVELKLVVVSYYIYYCTSCTACTFFCLFPSLIYFYHIGAVYGMPPPMMDQYGLSFPISPTMVSLSGEPHLSYSIY